MTIDFAYLNTVITHAAAVHGVLVSTEQVKLARIALKRLGILGKPKERDRRPTQTELDHIVAFLDGNPRQSLPAGRVVRFAVATAMRAEEICRIRWEGLDERKRTVIVRDRKDPRNKDGNDQKVPLLSATGYDAWALIQEQGRITGECASFLIVRNPWVGISSCMRYGSTVQNRQSPSIPVGEHPTA